MTKNEYTFIKIKDKYNKEWPWLLVCKDINTLLEHTEKYSDTYIYDGLRNMVISDISGKHYTHIWASTISILSEIKNKNEWECSADLQSKILFGKLESLNKFGVIYLRESGSYTLEIERILKTKKIKKTKQLIYPDIAKKNIQILKWPKGKHYYIKVGNIDICDKQGNYKWNTKKEQKK